MEHRLIIGLTGDPGAGKDTLAGYLESAYGFTRLAFADNLRFEICAAWHINTGLLLDRDSKTKPTSQLALNYCRNKGFIDWYFTTEAGILERKTPCIPEFLPRSPRWAMEKWGDYRLAQKPAYLLELMEDRIDVSSGHIVISDVRTTPEGLLVHSLRPSLIWKVVRTHNPRREQPSGHRTQTDYVPSDRWVQNLGDLARLQQEADLCMPGFVRKIKTEISVDTLKQCP